MEVNGECENAPITSVVCLRHNLCLSLFSFFIFLLDSDTTDRFSWPSVYVSGKCKDKTRNHDKILPTWEHIIVIQTWMMYIFSVTLPISTGEADGKKSRVFIGILHIVSSMSLDLITTPSFSKQWCFKLDGKGKKDSSSIKTYCMWRCNIWYLYQSKSYKGLLLICFNPSNLSSFQLEYWKMESY